MKNRGIFPRRPAVVAVFIVCCSLLSCHIMPTAGRLDPALFERYFVGTGQPLSPSMADVSILEIARVTDSLRRSGTDGRHTVTLTDTFGGSYSVGYQTPESLHGDTLYPCIIYLHGGTGSQASNKGDSAYLMLRMLADSMKIFLVSPSANRSAPWWSPAGLSRILQTLRFISLYYPVDRRRVILAGVSDGATGCWAAANTIFAPFAGFVAVSGFGGMLPELGMELRNVNLQQRPIYNVNAGNDRLYPIGAVTAFLDAMERAGVGVQRKIYSDEQHGFDYCMEEAGTLCRLVREWQLPAEGNFTGVFSTTGPLSIGHCSSFEGAPGAREFSVRGYCREDTFFLHTTGLVRLRMYFENEDRCSSVARFMVNNEKCRRGKPVEPTIEEIFRVMKQTCSPVVKNRVFYTIIL